MSSSRLINLGFLMCIPSTGAARYDLIAMTGRTDHSRQQRLVRSLFLQDDVKQELVDTSEQLIRTQAQRDRNALKLEQHAQKQGTDVNSNQEADDEGEMGVLAGHLNRIAALEKEVKRLKQVCSVTAACGYMLNEPASLVPSCVGGHSILH